MTSTLKLYSAYKPSLVEWFGSIPRHWEVRRLRNVADVRVSNVDKHVKEDEEPVRLCNYVDVYKNDYINEQMNFMQATATDEEIERFRLEKDDVLITKDSEAWDDIGVPALVTKPATDLISGYHLALLRPRTDELAGGYFLRALQSKELAYQFHIEAERRNQIWTLSRWHQIGVAPTPAPLRTNRHRPLPRPRRPVASGATSAPSRS